jgi:hypothetical protein
MAVTIPGAKGSTAITFTLSGSASGNYSSEFAGIIATQGNAGTLPDESTTPGAAFINTTPVAVNTIITTGSQFFFLSNAFANTLTLAASNEFILAGAETTVIEDGSVGGELVVFTGGTNAFEGSSTGVGGDTIVGGTGYDTITTGAGPSTVFAGAGNTLIYLEDTAPGGGDLVNMQAGTSTVYADGVSDTVFAIATGTINAGTGSLLVTTDGATITVIGGAGSTTGFLSAGTDLTFTSPAGDPSAVFIAGTGNETLDGSGAAGGFSFFADTVSGDTVNDSVTGGAGADFFSTGTGTEDITAGSGFAGFEIGADSGTITINDFGGIDSVNFAGLSVADETSLLATSSVVSGGNLTVTLADGTTVEFTGVTSLTGHLY